MTWDHPTADEWHDLGTTDPEDFLDMADNRRNDPDPFWSRVAKTDACWEWTGSRTAGGYGNLRAGGGNDYAHRVAYRLAKGPIPQGLVIDHLCRNRACCNPAHLEAVEQRENVLRGASPYGAVRTTCKHGHDITDPANVYTEPGGNHRCRACASIENAKRTEVRRARGDRRKILRTHCIHGHAFDDANTYVTPDGRRKCRTCTNTRARQYRKAAS